MERSFALSVKECELAPDRLPQNQSLLKVEGVTVSFGGLMALMKVSMDVHQGEVLGLIGPNGSGKSTLFNVITGFIKPDTGSVLYNGTEIAGLPPHKISRFGVARTFQMARPFPHLNTLQNIAVGRVYGRKPANSIRQGMHEAEEILEIVSLDGQGNTLAQDLTIMDRKRLELGRALAINPDLLLLDEFMTGLNPAEIEDALAMLRRINERGISLVVVEHIVKAVMSICQRIVVLNVGQVIADGSPEKVSRDPEVISAYLGTDHA
jgi:branched-chain amino acid transport system ATP-binding protein